MNVYQKAGQVLADLAAKKSSIKSLALNANVSPEQKKILYALVCKTHQQKELLRSIIESTHMKAENLLWKKRPEIVLCIVYDLLFGSGIKQAGKYGKIIKKYGTQLQAALSRMMIKKNVTKRSSLLQESKKVILPRYVRVNLVKSSVKNVIDHFKSEGHQLVPFTGSDYDEWISSISKLKKKKFMKDIHIPGVLVFCPSLDLHEHPLYLSGDIVLQGKSSCLPAAVLSPPSGSTVLDLCAAPGNKTSQLASMVLPNGCVFAFEKSAERLSIMNSLLLKQGIVNARTQRVDSLSIDPYDEKFKNAKYILVDPTCSSSGMVQDIEVAAKSDDNIIWLAEFQRKILLHAFKFPQVTRIVYSTCSTNVQENDEVVWSVLEEVSEEFGVIPILPSIPSRGKCSACIQLLPEKDATGGFYVACFERLNGQSSGFMWKSEAQNYKTEIEGKEKMEVHEVPRKDKSENIKKDVNGKSGKRAIGKSAKNSKKSAQGLNEKVKVIEEGKSTKETSCKRKIESTNRKGNVQSEGKTNKDKKINDGKVKGKISDGKKKLLSQRTSKKLNGKGKSMQQLKQQQRQREKQRQKRKLKATIGDGGPAKKQKT